DGGGVVALGYSNGRVKLNLFEQAGFLDGDALEGFESTQIADSRVWVREGQPRLVTWDDDGVVYTIVTDADDRRLARADSDMPHPKPDRGVTDRIGHGFNRMTGWLDAA